MSAARKWTLAAAQALFPKVHERTKRAVAEVESLVASGDPDKPQTVESAVNDIFERWMQEMERLGLEVKGPWLVDFDSGSGYYCWKWPEEGLAYFHSYEEGFAGRSRIQ